MELVHQVTLDVTVDGSTLEEVEQAVEGWLHEVGIDREPVVAKVLQLRGPGGGWPVVQFRTPSWKVMMKLLFAYHDDDLDTALEAYDELVTITL